MTRACTVFALAASACGSSSSPAPGLANWRAECETELAAARDRAVAQYAIRLERPVPDATSPNPDALMFPSANGIEVSHRVETTHSSGESTLFLRWCDGEWTYDRYSDLGFDLANYELARGRAFIRFEIFARDAPRWDAIVDGIVRLYRESGERCLARMPRPT